MRNFVAAVLVGMVVLRPMVSLAELIPCASQNLIDRATGLVEESSSPASGKIKLLDQPFNIRPNPDYHTQASTNIFADHDAQCVADVMTSRALMAMYYGWTTVNGKTYVQVKVIPRELAGDAPPSKEPSVRSPEFESPSLSWVDLLPKIKRKCATDWPDDFMMQSACVDGQRQGWEKLHADGTPASVQHQLVNPPASPSETRGETEKGHTVGSSGVPSGSLIVTAPEERRTNTVQKQAIPQFKDYPPDRTFTGSRAPLQLVTNDDKVFRTRLRDAANAKPNFAGHFVLTAWGCGTECYQGAAIDVLTGKVIWLPATICCARDTDDRFEAILFRVNSRLIVLSGLRNEQEGDDAAHFYSIEGDQFVPIADIIRPAR